MMPRRSLMPAYTEVQDPYHPELRGEARRLHQVLRRQPGQRPAGDHRRGGGHHRGPVHRRTRYPADHENLPHRRCCNGSGYYTGSSPRRGAVRSQKAQERCHHLLMMDGVVSFEKDSKRRRQSWSSPTPRPASSLRHTWSVYGSTPQGQRRRRASTRATTITEGSVEPARDPAGHGRSGCTGLPDRARCRRSTARRVLTSTISTSRSLCAR